MSKQGVTHRSLNPWEEQKKGFPMTMFFETFFFSPLRAKQNTHIRPLPLKASRVCLLSVIRLAFTAASDGV